MPGLLSLPGQLVSYRIGVVAWVRVTDEMKIVIGKDQSAPPTAQIL